MPSSKKKKQQRRGGGRPAGPKARGDPKPAAAPTGPSFEHPIGIKPDASWPRRMTKRPAPPTAVDDTSVKRMKAAALAVPEAERSPTAERLATAYKMMDEVDTFLEDEYTQEDDDLDNVLMSELICNDDLVRACGKLIRAVVLSDQRVGIPTSVVQKMPMPACMPHITELTPLGETKVQLVELPARAFVVLLANAFMSFSIGSPPLIMIAKKVVHELHAHVEGGYEYLDWSELHELGCDWLTEDLCRFAMATVGVKVSRALYRSSGEERRAATFNVEKPSTRRLLNDVEAFAKEQCRLRPACAVGYWNLGWVARQSPSRRNADGLAAAAECCRLFTKTYEIADAESDDFLSANARIEAAGMLALGGGGMVGLHVSNGEPVQVKRDYRSAFKTTNGGNIFFKVGVGALTRQGAAAAQANERRRAEQGVPVTRFEPGETLLVEWWVVLKLWNEAMVHYDAVCRFGHGSIVYGETSMWDQCAECLWRWIEKQRLDMDRLQYATGPLEPGISKRRDHGLGFNECEVCGKGSANNTCTRCKRVQYCSVECQRVDWNRGHKKECRKLAAEVAAFASQRK